MKYGSVKHINFKTLNVSEFDGGVDLNKAPTALPDNCLTDISNMWLYEGRLKTRPGLFAELSDAVSPPYEYYMGGYNYYATGSFVNVGGEKKQIIVSDVCIDDSICVHNIFFAGRDSRMVAAGEMIFRRTSSDIFYKPVNMVFYEGKPQVGGGIFLLATVVDEYNPTSRFCKIYEINSELNSWIELNDYYIPTIYINGRGNKYSLAYAENRVNVPAPVTLESPNMLNGRFHAYYTSDGFSNSFRLPFSNLANETIVCRIYYGLTGYVEWTISGNTIIDTQNLFGTDVSMMADREKGTIYFLASTSDYAIPIMEMYNENNIKITASKTIENGLERIASCTNTTKSEARILLSGGVCGNEIYTAQYKNPLYFPQESTISVGEDNKKITGLAARENKILAFKENETHILTLKTAGNYNTTSLLADNDKIFSKPDHYESVCLSESVGCKSFKSFAFCGKNAIWLAKDGRVYFMPSITSKNIYAISEKVQKSIDSQAPLDIEKAFAVYGNGYYILIIGSKGYIIKCDKSSMDSFSDIATARWFLWDFPNQIKLSDGFCIDSHCYFVCLGSEQNLCYISTLKGERDIDIYYLNGEVLKRSLKINSTLTTKTFKLSSLSVKKNIEAVYITLAAKGRVSIALNGKTYTDIDFGFSDEDYNKSVFKSVKLLRNLHGVEGIYITLSSDEDLSIGELEISYTNQT